MRPFKQVSSIYEIDAFFQEHQFSFLFISRENCSVCHGLLPQVQELMEKYPEIKLAHIDADEVEEVAGRFSIFTVPVLLLFVEGKEYVGDVRIVHVQLCDDRVYKYYKRILD